MVPSGRRTTFRHGGRVRSEFSPVPQRDSLPGRRASPGGSPRAYQRGSRRAGRKTDWRQESWAEGMGLVIRLKESARSKSLAAQPTAIPKNCLFYRPPAAPAGDLNSRLVSGSSECPRSCLPTPRVVATESIPAPRLRRPYLGAFIVSASSGYLIFASLPADAGGSAPVFVDGLTATRGATRIQFPLLGVADPFWGRRSWWC